MKLLEDFFKKTNLNSSDLETFFIYDLEQVRRNVKTLKNLFKAMEQIYFSVKSNPSPLLLENLNTLGVCFDVSSEKELAAAHKANSNYSQITVSGPAKTDAFIRNFSKLNVQSVHVDSKEEYDLLKNTDVNLSVRWPLESTYSQKVGLPVADLEAIVRDAASGKKLCGIHIYIGRERAQADVVSKTVSEIKKFIQSNRDAFIDKPNLFWGGGLPLANHLEASFFPQEPFFSTHLECGRAIVHNAGYYVTKVLEVKDKASEKIVIINGGLQHLATHFGSPRFGQDDVTVFFPSHPGTDYKTANIYGSLGTTTDVLVRNINIPRHLKRDDWIAIGPAGGYGYSAGTNQFLGPHDIKEFFIQDNQTRSIESGHLNYLEAGVYESQNS